MWPVSRALSNRALQAVPTACVPNVWQEGGINSVPALVCLAARHFSLSNQTVRLEWDPYYCLFPSPPEALSSSREKQTHACAHIFPPAQHQASSVHRYTYLETITREWMVQSVPSLFLSAVAVFLSVFLFCFYISPKTKSQAKWASLTQFFKHFFRVIESRVCLETFFSGMGEEEKKLSVCVWLYWTWWGMIL